MIKCTVRHLAAGADLPLRCLLFFHGFDQLDRSNSPVGEVLETAIDTGIRTSLTGLDQSNALGRVNVDSVQWP